MNTDGPSADCTGAEGCWEASGDARDVTLEPLHDDADPAGHGLGLLGLGSRHGTAVYRMDPVSWGSHGHERCRRCPGEHVAMLRVCFSPSIFAHP